jgi:hypothetical protein
MDGGGEWRHTDRNNKKIYAFLIDLRTNSESPYQVTLFPEGE